MRVEGQTTNIKLTAIPFVMAGGASDVDITRSEDSSSEGTAIHVVDLATQGELRALAEVAPTPALELPIYPTGTPQEALIGTSLVAWFPEALDELTKRGMPRCPTSLGKTRKTCFLNWPSASSQHRWCTRLQKEVSQLISGMLSKTRLC